MPPTKVADLAGHCLTIQQKIFKKCSLEGDHSVLRDGTKKQKTKGVPLSTDADIPFPWEVDPGTGEWFADNEEETSD